MALSIAKMRQKTGPSKLVVGVMAAAMTAFVGLSGVAGATGDMPSGNGYGGYGSQTTVNTTVNTNVGINVNGDHNVIKIVINYIFGGG